MKLLFKIAMVIFTMVVFDPDYKAHAITGKEIIEKSEASVRGNTQIAHYKMIVKTKRFTRSMEIKTWDNRKAKKSFSEILAPKKDAGNRFLLIDKTLRHFIPKLQTDIVINPSMMLQSWMGSDFTNDDIVKESSIIDDYNHKLLGRVTAEGIECYKVLLDPKPDAAVVWGKIIYFARTSDCLPVREEFYNEHNVMKKLMTFSSYKIMGSRTIPTEYKMQTIGKEGAYTLLLIKNVKFDTALPPGIFTLKHLKMK